MGFAKMRFEKITTMQALHKACYHNYRLGPVSSADESRRHLNYELAHLDDKQFIFKNYEYSEQPKNTFESRFHEKINTDYYNSGTKHKKPRKDAVKAIEVICELSQEDAYSIDVNQWAKDSLEWVRKTFNMNSEKYGDNIISAVVHMDEGFPHLHVVLIPIDEKGALNAKAYTGGYGKCTNMQTSYAQAVKQHGLYRGLQASRAVHTNRRKYYEAINKAVSEAENEKYQIRPGETVEHYQKRVQKEMETKNLKLVNAELNHKRKIEELKTTQRNTLIETRKEMHEVERERDLYKRKIEKVEKKHGSISEVLKKAQVTDNLQYAFDNFPDENLRNDTKKKVNRLLQYTIKKQKEELLSQQNNSERK